MKFNLVKEAIEDIRLGKMIVVIDDEDRENEGDILMAAEMVTSESVNFMAKYGRGMICAPITKERAEELDLDMMVRKNNETMKTAFTVTVDHSLSTTGISAFERAKTLKELSNPQATTKDFLRPGHIFPLVANKGGVLKRAGHTEAIVDLAKLAGLSPAGVICEIMNEDGTMARTPELFKFVEKHKLKIITIADLIEYRRHNEKIVTKAAVSKMPTKYGEFRIAAFEESINGEHHVALIKGDIENSKEPITVRVHSECLTGDAMHSMRCDCGEQLDAAMKIINEKGVGVILYMRQEGRGIGLVNKIRAYELQDGGCDTVEANVRLGFKPDHREYGVGAQILVELGIKRLKLLTNNPRKLVGLEGYGIEIVDRIPLQIKENEKNSSYLETKKNKMGHMLDDNKEEV